MAVTIKIKRGNFANLPSSAPAGELHACLDTGQLFVGTGPGMREISGTGGVLEIPATKQWFEDSNQRIDQFVFTYSSDGRTETWNITWDANTGNVITSEKVVT